MKYIKSIQQGERVERYLNDETAAKCVVSEMNKKGHSLSGYGYRYELRRTSTVSAYRFGIVSVKPS